MPPIAFLFWKGGRFILKNLVLAYDIKEVFLQNYKLGDWGVLCVDDSVRGDTLYIVCSRMDQPLYLDFYKT